MWSPRYITAGFSSSALKQVRNGKFAQALGNHRRPGPAVTILLLQRCEKLAAVDIKVQTDNMYCATAPQTGKLDTGDQHHSIGVCCNLGFSKAANRIVIRKSEMGNMFLSSAS